MFHRRHDTSAGRQRATVALIPLLLLLAGCWGKDKPETEVNVDPPDVLYNEALADLEAGDARRASGKFDTIDKEHPYSEEARKAMIRHIYAGRYSASVKRVRPRQVLQALLARTFR